MGRGRRRIDKEEEDEEEEDEEEEVEEEVVDCACVRAWEGVVCVCVCVRGGGSIPRDFFFVRYYNTLHSPPPLPCIRYLSSRLLKTPGSRIETLAEISAGVQPSRRRFVTLHDCAPRLNCRCTEINLPCSCQR